MERAMGIEPMSEVWEAYLGLALVIPGLLLGCQTLRRPTNHLFKRLYCMPMLRSKYSRNKFDSEF
jgi:hypothetical protein